ncbi:MAG: MFS transporter [Thermoanaerobaculia bacterium]
MSGYTSDISKGTGSGSRHLALATISFAVCFAAWGLVGALAPLLRELFHLTASQTGLLIATPVLLGSLARIPMGVLAERFGARPVFTILMLVVAATAVALPYARTFTELLLAAFCLGLAGSSFSIGTGYVSRWTPPAKQGAALGIYGAGNVGQSIAVFGAPVLAAALSWPMVFRSIAGALLIWAAVFGVLARDAPRPANVTSGFGPMLKLLSERLAWILSAFYFLTFGGFVAFGIYLPTLLKSDFHLSPADAGLRAAGFVLVATAMRPMGGWLSDKIGGARVLAGVFFGIAPFGLLLTWPAMIPFTVGALGCAALLGLGNGAVFKLVAEHFPGRTGVVSGLVGAMGGLGGFFPPLLLGVFKDKLGTVWPGFVLLVIVSVTLGVVNQRVFLAHREAEESRLPANLLRTAEKLRAGAWATLAAGLLCASIVVGSRNLANFDPALVVYTFATIFATWGIAYHYHVWIQKPPTKIYWRRGFQLLRARGIAKTLFSLIPLFWSHIIAQRFIAERSRMRWWMHQLLFWGCILAVLITFPLVFGWIQFRSAPDDQMTYVTYLFGFAAGAFRIRTPFSWVLFHGLDFAAILVLGGISLSLGRRMRDQGARALQDFGRDFFPLVVLFAISVTGLALTASSLWLRGSFYGFLSILHALTVVAALLYLPFGKFFHVFQRPAQLGVKLYQEAGAEGPQAACLRCGAPFASAMHVADLGLVLGQLGFDYRLASGGSWHALCQPCKRVSIASSQLDTFASSQLDTFASSPLDTKEKRVG